MLTAQLADQRAQDEKAAAEAKLARLDEALSTARQQDKLREATLGTLRSVSAALDAAETKLARLEGALTPSAETKAAYMGEFSIPFPIIDQDGDEVMLRPNVPWTTIKEIMAAIRARAALTEGTPE
jgi:outer membrane protein TolC